MFATAIANCAEFTRAVLISVRTVGDKITTGCGTFVLLNSEGWTLTAGHVLDALRKHQNDKAKYEAYRAAKQAIEANQTVLIAKRKRQLKALQFDSNWIVNASYFWGKKARIEQWYTSGLSDLAAVKLVELGFKPNQKFAKFGDPSVELPQGRSLCKLGYPFHHFKTRFNSGTNHFTIEEMPPLVRYPLDGILTRYNIFQTGGGKTAKFVEMSTPGLKGQSGGPLFDTAGVVWGIQSRTKFMALGFSPEVESKGKKVTEHQFLNVGLAAYTSEISAFLDKHGIAYERA
jgi:hypothetical protein